jgi:hypothetical protein
VCRLGTHGLNVAGAPDPRKVAKVIDRALREWSTSLWERMHGGPQWLCVSKQLGTSRLSWCRENPTGIYDCPKINSVPHEAGVYIFGRWHGDHAVPLYVGRSTDLRLRLEQHLNFSLKLMIAIRNAKAGARFFLFCTIEGTSHKKLATLEVALMAHILGVGYELLNKQGTKKPNHTVTFLKNNHTSLDIVPRFVRLQA